MRILHIITSLRTGGAEHLLADLLPKLREYGQEAEVLLFDGTNTPFYSKLNEAGIKIHFLGIGYKEIYKPLNLMRLMRFFAHHKYDIVHTHNTPCQLLAAILHKYFTFQLVTTEHNTNNRRRNWTWFKYIDRWMYRQYGAIICVSDKTKMNLINYLIDKDIVSRIHIIYNGIRSELYKQSAKRAIGKIKDIIMVAEFRAQKDQPTLIRAISLLPKDYHLTLVGDGPERKSCEELVNTLCIADRVTFAGVRIDIPQLLADADVAVISSHYEGMPLACIEAMAAGKPLIASDVDGIHEVVAEAGLLFPHEDANQLAVLIKQVCSDESTYTEVVERCLKRAKLYDIADMVKQYLIIYKKLYKNEEVSDSTLSGPYRRGGDEIYSTSI
jgi:glycosyltransferase involved in cell wall biosynthesis